MIAIIVVAYPICAILTARWLARWALRGDLEHYAMVDHDELFICFRCQGQISPLWGGIFYGLIWPIPVGVVILYFLIRGIVSLPFWPYINRALSKLVLGI